MWTDGYITINYIIHGFDDFVVLDNGEQYIVDYMEETPFFMINDSKYYLNEFMKVR